MIIISLLLCLLMIAYRYRTMRDMIDVVSIPSPTPFAALQEPICMPENFKSVWKEFLKDGKYRIVRPTEISGTYWPTHCSDGNNVIVMVIDQRAAYNPQYRLAYFKAKDWQKGQYKLYWVSHQADLRGCYVNNLSSDLILNCGAITSFLRWDAKQNSYAFLP